MLANSQTQSHGSGDASKQSRALTGTVTKLLDNFGFIDDSVFFQLSVVKGGDVQVGDKVYCECSYSEHLPFKWNATKVHLVQTSVRSGGSQSVQSGSQSAASQVATTYLQHRLQQQQQQQSREEGSNPMSAIVNSSHNYYSSQSVSNSSYGSQQSFDFNKTQQAAQAAQAAQAQAAVAAAQQLASYYGTGRSETNSFSQLQYTSTPGSAFVSATLPFTQQIQQNLLSTQPRSSAQNSYKSSNSRWEREERNRTDDKFRSRESERSRNTDSIRKRNDSRDRSVSVKEGRDEFGRELRNADKNKERDRERERERERIEKERERRYKRSVSPTSSISSQTIARVRRRPYEPVNIPKLAILKNPLNVYDIKQRYSANLHIPSDLKEVIVNSNFSLNVNEIPKPISFRVVENKDEHKKKDSKKADSPKSPKEIKDEDKSENKEEINSSKNESNEIKVNSNKNDLKDKEKNCVEQPIALKQTYKYGVKVLLIALPSMSDIFERIFGSDFDAVPTGTKSYFLHFNKLLSFLVSRNSNDGFSLIGGKFNPHLDGYLPDSEEPNLIGTAIRIVGEQTGMNLSKCGKWRLIATFIYNRDSSVDPLTPNLELNRVYMPDVWSAFDGIYDTLKTNENINELENDNQIVLTNDNIENNSELTFSTNDKNESISAEDSNNVTARQEVASDMTKDSSPTGVEPSSDSNTAMDLTQTNINEVEESDSQLMDSVPILETNSNTVDISTDAIDLSSTTASEPVVESSVVDSSQVQMDSPSAPNAVSITSIADHSTEEMAATPSVGNKTGPSVDTSELQLLLSKINDLKVAELRAELEKRGARLKGSLKKADLISKLRQIITQLLEDEDVISDEVKNDWWAQRILSKEGNTTDDSETHDNVDDKSMDSEVIDEVIDEDIDEEALLKDSNDDLIDKNETIQPNDVVMTETESEDKEVEIVDEIKETEERDTTDSNDIVVESVVEMIDESTDEKTETKDKDSEQKPIQNGTAKRKIDSELSPKESKKSKNGDIPQEIIPTKVTDGCVYVKGSENLTVITLHEALNHQRYDQFEMSIASEVVRESLIHHFSHYVLSTLVSNHKNPKEDKSPPDLKTPLAVNYVHLSFAYFDSNHCGHILSEDVSKLLSNSNFTLSRKAFNLLVNNEDKVQYRDLLEPKELLPIKNMVRSELQSDNNINNPSKPLSAKIYERNGTIYDINQLIDQSESDEKLKVKLNEELTANKEKISQLTEYIQELESRQKKMTVATEKQNDEICSLKREREITKNKYDLMRKTVETSVTAFNKLLDKEKEEKEKDKEKAKEDK